jgi:folate-binding protein YgfZ
MGDTTPERVSLLAQATAGKYLGANAVLDYGDSKAEFALLRQSCGLFPLGWRAKVSVTGKDRVRWLHNMVTNNVRDLPLNRGNYNFVLNAQGRILGDIYIYNRGESLVIDTDRSQVEPLLAAMKRFIIMDKVEMSVGPVSALAICGPNAETVLRASGTDTTGMEPLEVRDLGDECCFVRGPENKPGWYEWWLPVREGKFVGIGIPPGEDVSYVGTQALEWWRVVQGIPQYGQDIRERDLPQETEQMHAINFTKGCYIGQEIVERIRSRGQVHRKFTGFEFEDGPPVLAKAEAEGRVVAEVTSIATVPTPSGERNIGLGYVRREAVATGSQVELGGHKARIVDLPFTI